MTDDLLSRATRALRQETEQDDSSAEFTRARVMSSLHQSRVTRRKRLAVVIPIAVSFGMATAYAAATGKLPRVATTILHALGGAPTESAVPAPSASPHARAAQSVNPAPAPSHVETVAPPEPTPPVPERAPLPSARAGVKSAPTESPARADLPDESDPGFELYRTAHRAHFIDHDPARALPAWDAYLRATPTGRFALEARYNRALCLVRLGRNAEASSALAPFAQGAFGGYRQREARELMQAIADAGTP